MEAHVESFDNETVFYLANNKNLQWIDYKWNVNVDPPLTAVKVNLTTMPYMIGRYNMSEFVNVGKFMAPYGFYFIYDGENNHYDEFELLVCNKNDQ